MKAWEAREHLLKMACDMQEGQIKEALRMGADALSRQSPLLVSGENDDELACPICGESIGTWNDRHVCIFCRGCGQLIMWKAAQI